MKPPWRYRLLVRLLSPLLLSYTLWRSLKDGGSRYWWQRLGVYSSPKTSKHADPQTDTLWVHAASVGEVFTVLPLIKRWQSQHIAAHVLITTGTPTGAAVLQQQGLPNVRHQYLPVDFPGASHRFVKQLSCKTAWIVETEIWPWLYSWCEHHKIDLTIINGRLSTRTSQQANGLLASSYRHALSKTKVLARSQQDVDNFIALGSPKQQVHLIGNLKYANWPLSTSTQPLIDNDYVLAASTHDNEEQQLVSSWIKHNQHGPLLVIAPRHPERGPTLLREIKALGASVSQRSSGQVPSAHDQIYLADTLGELQAWYEHANACFVGGSLIERGGHNMLEPARYACPIVVGKHTHNFDDIMSLMLQAKALQRVETAEAVVNFLMEAAHQDSEHKNMALRARQVATDSQSVLQRYLDQLNLSVS